LEIGKEGAQPLYNLFAGINGAGKTALCDMLCKSIPLGERISIDEIASTLGDWRDRLVQIKAARQAMALIDRNISNKVSFHQETTLSGDSVLKRIRQASEQGFRINLYYVGVDSLSVAVERVHKRIESGGHGINDSLMVKRYREALDSLRRIMSHCDKIFFYDNTLRLKPVAIFSGGRFNSVDPEQPRWLGELLCECSYERVADERV